MRSSRPIAVLAALTLVATTAAACTTTHGLTTSKGPVHRVDPSAGCGRTAPAGAVPPGREREQTLHGNTVSGSYLLSVPPRYTSRHPVPLVLLFNGFDSDPAQFSILTGLPARGSKDGYLVVVPHSQAGAEFQIDGHGTDATFVNEIVSALEHTYCVDRRSLFAAGFSAGAAFAIAYACANQTQIAAIATVAVEFQLGCTRPMSILAFHGTKDPLVPYRNGAIGLSLPGVTVHGTERNMADWAKLDHCRVRPRQTRIGAQVNRQVWDGCSGGAEVALYTVKGGGHSWPGADPKKAIGLTTEQINATSQILTFFTGLRNRSGAAGSPTLSS